MGVIHLSALHGTAFVAHQRVGEAIWTVSDGVAGHQASFPLQLCHFPNRIALIQVGSIQSDSDSLGSRKDSADRSQVLIQLDKLGNRGQSDFRQFLQMRLASSMAEYEMRRH